VGETVAQPATRVDANLRATRDRVIEVRDLRMSYGSVEAVSGIDLEVRQGEVFAFLGPNGAGKTTTVEILGGLRHRSAGEVTVLEKDPARAGADWRASIGVVLQESEPEAELTVEECVSLYAGYYPKHRPVDETLGLVGLADRPSLRCGQLSGGQRRRLDVALALVGDPDLLFLDEPTTGFDPSARRAAWEIISSLRDLGKTIFLTTHYMEEAERLADRIAVIAKGQIVAEGTGADIGERATKASLVSFSLPLGTSVTDLPPTVASAVVACSHGKVEVKARGALALVGELATWAKERCLDLPDLEVTRPRLEDIYLELTEERP
jgi:ABC-2 type transport system ATP-binding protein